MATQPKEYTQENTHAQSKNPTLIKPVPIVPIKVGFMGEQGSGKTSTAGLLAAGLSKEFHNGAPVWVTDPEKGWQFLRPVIFDAEGIKLEQRTVPTFKAMLDDLAAAERAGACVWAVELGKIWMEILRTLRKAKPYNWGGDLVDMWTDFVARFLNSKLHCLVLGRIQDIVEEVQREDGSTQQVKIGEGLKAGGQKNNFGYEPHIVLRMTLEQKPRVKKGKTFEEEGRMVHVGRITKDRTWASNGAVFRWPDRPGYKQGDFRYVLQSFKPHFLATQKTENVILDMEQTSDALVSENGNSEWHERRERKSVLSAELHATMDMLWGGTAIAAKQMRMKVFEHVFGFKSKEAADAAPLEKIERGVRILQAFERRVKREKQDNQIDLLAKDDLEILAQLDIDIREFDEGVAEENDLPF